MTFGNISSVREKHSIEKERIFNMDKVPVWFDMVAGVRVVDKKNVKRPIVATTGSEKKHVTIVLACAANGTQFPP